MLTVQAHTEEPSSGAVQYMHDDPHCDNLEDIFGDVAVAATLVPLKRKTIVRTVQYRTRVPNAQNAG